MRILIRAAVVCFALAFSLSAGPTQMTYQGRITDPGGNPVPDGNYTITCRIYDVAGGGVAIYNSGGIVTPAVEGIFTVQLINVTEDLFNGDTRYMGIQVGADPEIFPRTRLTSVPYAYRVETLDSATGGAVTGSVSFNNAFGKFADANSGFNSLSTYTTSGVEACRIWGPSWGQVLLRENDGDIKAELNANFSSGGSLVLRDGVGLGTVVLNTAFTGDLSITVPNDAINAAELLNEPGLASSFDILSPTVNGSALQTLDSVSITVPSAGYVVVTISGFIASNHIEGTETVNRLYASTGSASIDFDNLAITRIPSAQASDVYYDNFSIVYVDQIAAGTQKYYLTADEFSGAGDFTTRHRMVLQFYPTAYGTVVETSPPPVSSATHGIDGLGTWKSSVRTITLEEHQAMVAAEVAKIRAELDATSARLQKLEAQQQQNNEQK